jgi:hypothetical protein
MDPFALLSAGVHYDKSRIPKVSGRQHTHSVALPLPGEQQQQQHSAEQLEQQQLLTAGVCGS